MKISIVIPALNEEKGIAAVISQIPVQEFNDRGDDVEILVVDNGSTDRTAEFAEKAGARVVNQSLRGYGNAYKAGFAAATGDIIVTGDADMTYPFDFAPRLVDFLLDNDLEFLSTNRLSVGNYSVMSRSHIYGNYFFSALARFLFKWPFKDSQSGMWIFKRSILPALEVESGGMAFSQELKLEAFFKGFRCGEIDIDFRSRVGKVKLNTVKDGIINLMSMLKKSMKYNVSKGDRTNHSLKKRKKIAFVYDAIFPFIKGGAERRFYEIGRRFAEMGYEVHFYGMKSWEGDDIIEYQGMKFHGICKNYPLYDESGKRSVRQVLAFGLASFKLWKEDFDVIDCCGFPYSSIVPIRILSLIRRKPMFSTWHEVWGRSYWQEYAGKFLGLFGYFLEKVLIFFPGIIIAASGHTADNINEILSRKKNVFIIPNGVDISKIQSQNPSSEKSDLIFAGRLVDYKNIDILIGAVNILVKNKPDLILLIIGDGPEKERLEDLSKKFGLEKNIHFLGFLASEEKMYSLLMSSRLAVLPSTREGFGIFVLESNACGLPVLTIGHIQNAAQDLVSSGMNGSLTVLDERKMAEAISLELENPKSADACRAYAEMYDWDRIASMSEKMYFSDSKKC